MAKENEVNCTEMKRGSWLTYRPDIKVLDCTIRDGGLVNNFYFKDEFVKAVYHTLIEMNVDYMEIGKIVNEKALAPSKYGIWNYCKEEDIRRVIGDNEDTDLKIAVMADIGRTFKDDIRPKDESIVDMVRVACYIHQIPAALELIEDAHKKGYETTCNLMAVSKCSKDDIKEALRLIVDSPVDVVYLVDSFGSYYSEQIRDLTRIYLEIAEAKGKVVGYHGHNNQQLAYANTVETLICGTSYLDATIGGLGRGAGNCPLELLIGFLKNPKYHIVPLLKFIQDYIVPLQKEIHWGYDIAYMLTGQLNEHPRSAIKFIDEKGTDYVDFFNSLCDVQE
ncbi:MAG TPA: aldolase catalytic domain-containing protein [Spirochaetota bacterium]|nr:aldolase catalytic domain-containing protein [Spirochaetota bacterium]